MEKRWCFLSFRIQVCGIMTGLLGILMWFLLLYYTVRAQGSLVSVILLGIGYLAVAGFVVFQILLPYKKADKQIRLFLAGYSATGLKDPTCSLSPATAQLLSTVIRLLESDKMLSANKRQAQYLALQNQINPHFLYNTLESIRSEAMEAGITNVTNMTEALANFFRYTISKVENMVTLEEELQNIKTYFYIQQYRFEERIRLSIEYDEEDRDVLYKSLLPKLTLQPVVENIIIHGIERKMGEGIVRIILKCTEHSLIIQVSDNGVGMEPEVYENLNQKLNQPVFESIQMSQNKGGIALVNVNNRIHLIFGEEYGMSINSTLGVGTDVTIHLPRVTSMRKIQIGEDAL